MTAPLVDDRPSAGEPTPPEVERFLSSVTRRLRRAWAAHLAGVVAPVAAVLGLALVILGRLRPWSWPEPAAVAVVLAAIAVWVLGTFVRRIAPWQAARAADRSLATGDALEASLDLDGQPGPLVAAVHQRASTIAAGHPIADAVPIVWPRRPLLVALAVSVVAGALAVIANPQDDVRARRAAEQAALSEEAALLEEAADALEEAGDVPAADELAEALRALAEELEAAPDLEAGLDAIDDAAADLAERLDPGFLSQKAAALGLERGLGGEPLPGAEAGQSASEQLAAAADALDELTPEERAALADVIDWGLVDTFRRRYDDAPGLYTYYDYTAGHFHKREGMRIDYVLATSSLADRSTLDLVDRNARKGSKPSDHAPVLAGYDGS